MHIRYCGSEIRDTKFNETEAEGLKILCKQLPIGNEFAFQNTLDCGKPTSPEVHYIDNEILQTSKLIQSGLVRKENKLGLLYIPLGFAFSMHLMDTEDDIDLRDEARKYLMGLYETIFLSNIESMFNYPSIRRAVKICEEKGERIERSIEGLLSFFPYFLIYSSNFYTIDGIRRVAKTS